MNRSNFLYNLLMNVIIRFVTGYETPYGCRTNFFVWELLMVTIDLESRSYF